MRRFWGSLTVKIGVVIILVEILGLAVAGYIHIGRFSREVEKREAALAPTTT